MHIYFINIHIDLYSFIFQGVTRYAEVIIQSEKKKITENEMD